ncbi:MAG: type 2 isopentenyl-diphosphate Delta-isomerase [Balneola sp.]|nr:type 2 isopentenyl-diphosphate Delta-isomerase [Balneola sp.]MBO6650694.1 type 2 isopentenyl-diphosphate Delta-isomerase [Balneola sp.]MBO6710606.1 type 2 isopentenyl-diphosphate Delta-isomerase [Balneola sp.]MBO6799292.1 type 2 isopentenyl-diphosphate Delta-isomerase [Balneola sp.]MBO6869579.1 type 2 isopentenyl-diphosphate Delta-isomerase [Balneola sp.]
MSIIGDRKKDHIKFTLNEQTQYDQKTGFERYQFIHNALPEVNLDEVSTEAVLLGRTFSFPLFISSMTGGYTDAGQVNAIIAEFCESQNLPFGVGSQRAMLEDDSRTETFSIARKKAPNAFICSNIGGAQLVGNLGTDKVRRLVECIEADAVIVHLNPLQELMQPEGDRNFKGILNGIEDLVKSVSLPVIVKETGAGISQSVAKRLLNAGISVIDVAGAGGTSWAKVENQRESNLEPNFDFDDWGISTTDCLIEISNLQWDRNFEIISSGGIRSAFEIAKSFCLGANFTASAQPIIKAISANGLEGVHELFFKWEKDLKTILTLLGCKSVEDLNSSHLKLKS